MIQGTLFTGLGKAKHFIEIYKDKIQQQVGFLPYLGTLNLKITDDSFLNTLPKKRIEEFFIDDKNYGAVILYPIKLNTIEANKIEPENIAVAIMLKKRETLKKFNELSISICLKHP